MAVVIGRRSVGGAIRMAVVLSAALLSLRLSLIERVGFGDAEALYASYALYPQPSYLDHPGLIGQLARWLGAGGAPLPARAHLFTAILATLVPWFGAFAAWLSGASPQHTMRTVFALALLPEMAIGLFGLTPDLPLAAFWLMGLGALVAGVQREPGSTGALAATLAFAAAVGFCTITKASGVLLGLAGLAWLVTRDGRRHLRSAAPWLGLLLCAVIVAPVVLWEVRQGYPMLTHRFVTQAAGGPSLKTIGRFVGGQLVYVTPFFLIAGGVVLRDLYLRRDDPVSRVLLLACWGAGLPLTLLCLWSPAAEPHWVAPALLPLALHLARMQPLRRWLSVSCLLTGLIAVSAMWLMVATPTYVQLAGSGYVARYDLTNDLYAWGPGGRLLDEAAARAQLETHRLPVIVGPHWVVCAQAQAHVGRTLPVGCNSPQRDDFDRWLPRQRWLEAPVVLYVHDSRFDVDPAQELPDRRKTAVSKVDVRRGDVVVRTIWVTRLEQTRAVGLDTSK